jgi:photosystem II stability/assembly factor-like uncharacterized protein
MKNVIIFILLLVGFHSQAQWETTWAPTTKSLHSVYFVNENYGFAVGDTGTIIKTTNSGMTWTLQSYVTANSLYSVFFLNVDTGFVVGQNSIMRTIDGGTSWTEQFNGNGFVAYSVFFPSHSTGYVVGSNGFIIKTTDFGTTWNSLYTGYGRDFYSVYFPTIDTGYVVGACTPGEGGQQTIIKTVNGGNTWFSVNDTNYHWSTFWSVFFINKDEGYVAGYQSHGIIYKTTNGGESWIHSDIPELAILYSIYFTSSEVGYTAGTLCEIFKTHNGIDWVNQFGGFGIFWLNSVYFANDTVGFAVGFGGLIMKTTNGGAVGINESPPIISEGLSITPNPANNVGVVSSNHTGNGEIIQIDGKIVKAFKIYKSSQEIDLKELPPGLYFIRLIQENGISSSKKFFIAR